MNEPEQVIAFQGKTRIAQGPVPDVALAIKHQVSDEAHAPYVVIRCSDGQQIDLDISGGEEAIRRRYGAPTQPDTEPESTQKPRGRPRLGVVGREVTLLPRHWAWLDRQRGGASAALRRLVEAERKLSAGEDSVRQAQDVTQRFMYIMAGNLPGFEEATRALYAADKAAFAHQIRLWPEDIRECTIGFAREAFTDE